MDVGVSAAMGFIAPTWLGNVGKGLIQYGKTKRMLTSLGGPALGAMARPVLMRNIEGAAISTAGGTGLKAVLPAHQYVCDDECARYRLNAETMGLFTSLF